MSSTSNTSGLVVYSVKSVKINNFELHQTISVHHIGEILQGSGTFPIWEHINDLFITKQLDNFASPTGLIYKIVTHEIAGKIKDGNYDLTEWIRVNDEQ